MERPRKRRENLTEVLRNASSSDREELKEEARLFLQYISEKRAARGEAEKICSTAEPLDTTSLDVLEKLREQGLQNPMEMEEINSFIDEARKRRGQLTMSASDRRTMRREECFMVKGKMSLNELFAEISSRLGKMTIPEFKELLRRTEDPDEKEFYSVVFNTILQQQQRKVIEANKF